MKKLLTSMLALLLVLMLPTVAFAGTYNASSFAELQDIFDNAASDSDVEIVVNLNGDIAWEDFLTAVQGKVFKLRGTGTNTLYYVAFNGDGTVLVEEVGGVDGYVWTQGNVDLTVNSDVTSSRGANEPTIEANDKSNITVNGNVTSNDVVAVGTTEESSVSVNGNVTSENYGTASYDDSTITVNGNVNAGDGAGVMAADNSTTNVTGDVTVSSTPIASDAPEMNDGTYEHQGGAGVMASGNATVTVGGNVTGGDSYGAQAQGGHGVDTYENLDGVDSTTVTVGGNVTGGDAYSQQVSGPGPVDGKSPTAGDGINKSAGSTVTVGGNSKGGDGHGTASAGNGITLYFDINTKEGAVTVNGTAMGGSNEEEKNFGGHAILFNIAQRAPFSGENEFLGDYVMGELLYSAMYLREIALNKGMSEADATAVVNSYLDAINAILATYPENSADWTEAQGKEIFDKADAIFKSMTPGYFGPTQVNVQRLSTQSGNELFGAGNMTQSYIDTVAAANVNYLINLPTVTGGVFTSDKASAKEGETVTLTAKPDKGYAVDYVKVNGKVITGKDGVYSFVMPRAGAEITYAFKASTQGGVPKTNDTNNVFLFVGIMALLAAGAVTMKKHIEVK